MIIHPSGKSVLLIYCNIETLLFVIEGLVLGIFWKIAIQPSFLNPFKLLWHLAIAAVLYKSM